MGGSSLGPEVLAQTFGTKPGFPRLQCSTRPTRRRSAASKARSTSQRTLFIVSSKSGSTLEPNIFKQYFYERAKAVLGEAAAAQHFVAITDPGSSLEKIAHVERLPARLATACRHRRPLLGAVAISAWCRRRRSASTRAASSNARPRWCAPVRRERAAGREPGRDPRRDPRRRGSAGPRQADDHRLAGHRRSLGAWLEQLLAESTGKLGRGIIPVDAEPLGTPAVYGNDRLFVYLRLASDQDAEQESARRGARSGRASRSCASSSPEPTQLGQEFFRWEIATAVAGAILGINPFDQPDVEAQQDQDPRAHRRLRERPARLPSEAPLSTDGGIKLFADPANAAALKARRDRPDRRR